ncbi:MAG TPA: exodeoxyribonuclease VII large subunit [Planctomycetaceae bacterium]|nr:exodeoxyribonuclease VII large subunit [Planctomycetaceae bacterium]
MPQDAPEVLSVGQLTAILRGVVEQCFPDVWVAGEVSNCQKAGSGHIYFTLKDEEAQLKAVMWKTAASRLKFDLRDGMEVIANGALEVYPPRGQYQIICQRLQPQGIGGLELALRQLQEKLSAEGLFEPERKRPLPEFPRQIALITSPTGAAVRDMLQILTRRWPLAKVLLLPVAVQGDGAKEQIAAALNTVRCLPDVDVVICGRGGGSLEDLWAFNEEIVARAIAACPVPVVSAVGHEIDVTIADLVADRRALTPSEAAELVVPSVDEIRVQLHRQRDRLTAALRQRARHARATLDALSQRRCFARPLLAIHEQATRLDELEIRLKRAAKALTQKARASINALAGQLDALSPLGVLSRGYSLTKRVTDGHVLRRAADANRGERLSTLLDDGEIISVVESIDADE